MKFLKKGATRNIVGAVLGFVLALGGGAFAALTVTSSLPIHASSVSESSRYARWDATIAPTVDEPADPNTTNCSASFDETETLVIARHSINGGTPCTYHAHYKIMSGGSVSTLPPGATVDVTGSGCPNGITVDSVDTATNEIVFTMPVCISSSAALNLTITWADPSPSPTATP